MTNGNTSKPPNIDSLPEEIQSLIEDLVDGDRDPVEDADDITSYEDLDFDATHHHGDYTVTIRFTPKMAWHNVGCELTDVEFDFGELGVSNAHNTSDADE